MSGLNEVAGTDQAPHFTGYSHTGIQVADLDRSIDFYVGLLGFEQLWRWVRTEPYIQEIPGYPNVELHAALLRAPASEALLEVLDYRNVDRMPIDTSTGNPGTAHTAFNVTDLVGMYERLAACGVKFVSRPVTPTVGPNKGGKAVYMIDPDGIRVELIESARRLEDMPLDNGEGSY